MKQEVEYKWQTHSFRDFQAFLKFTQQLGAIVSKVKLNPINDFYVDTPEYLLHHSLLECRIRLTKNQSELTLKSLPNLKQGIFIREEKNFPLPHFTSIKPALKYCRETFFPNIQPLFEIRNERRIHTLTLPDGTTAEACFDQVIMVCGKKKLCLKEIELEFKSGKLKNFKIFVNQLSPLELHPSKSSKYEKALHHFYGDSIQDERVQDNAHDAEFLKANIVKLFMENSQAVL